MRKQLIGLVTHHLDRRSLDELLIILILNGRRTSQNHLEILKPFSYLNHGRQIILDFLQPATRQQSQDWSMNIKLILCTELLKWLLISGTEFIHLLRSRITYIMYRIVMFFLIERHLERQDREHLGNVSPNATDSPFLPSPYLRRNIIISRDIRLLFQELSNIEIKAGIIHQDNYIRFPFHDIILTHLHVGKDGSQMQQNGNEAHISQFFIMLHTSTSLGSHQIASEEPELSKFIHFFQ